MIGVVADDTTGANDMGIMFKKSGKAVKILVYSDVLKDYGTQKVDVVIVDTDSRLDPREVSEKKVAAATQFLKDMGCTTFYKKTCSVFRGNIGFEFDSMKHVLNESYCPIVLAFPEALRTTIHGYHYVNDTLLEHTNFAFDPVHPMHHSNLKKIIGAQTDQKIGNIYLEDVRQGVEHLKKVLADHSQQEMYTIIDAINESDMQIVAQAVSSYKMLGGSSAIGKYLLKEEQGSNLDMQIPPKNDQGVLVVSGSLTPQTKAQTQYLIENGIKSLVIDSRDILDPDSKKQLFNDTLLESKQILNSGQDLLLMPDNDPNTIEATKKLGNHLGLNEFQTSKAVSQFLADVTGILVTELNLNRFVIAGGDTSGTVCRKLQINGNYIIEEVETGVPVSLSIDNQFLFILKSGSFGTPAFLTKAVAKLKAL